MSVEVDIILYVAGAITVIAAAAGVVTKIVRNAIISVSKEVTEQVARALEDEFMDKLNSMDNSLRQIIEENRCRDEETRILSIKNAASRIFEAHSHYMKRGNISTFALANLEELFANYELRGGNSYAKLCMEQIRKLPVFDNLAEHTVLKQEELHRKSSDS